jgi:acetyl esterase/lipase
MIGLSGPYDFLPLQRGYLEEVFPPALRARSQPIRYVSSDAPATLLIHGNDDNTVRIANSRTLADVLTACGVQVELKTYDGVGHARVVAAIAPPLDFLGKTLQDTTAFIRRELQRPAGDSSPSEAQQCGRRFSGY